ncbi:MAG: hypothetical protein U0165_17375 [Polyangiaceae bacterium]
MADFVGDSKLEVVIASRDTVYMFDATGAAVPGFPVSWQDELRSVARRGMSTATARSTSWRRHRTAAPVMS